MIDCDTSFPSPRGSRAWLILLLCLLASGCGKMVKSFGEVAKLHAEIIREFGEKEVGINLNNDTVLTVSFVNSPLNDKGRVERLLRAEQTVAFVKDHYSSIGKMNAIWVAFVRSETHFVFIHNFETIDVFGFDKYGQLLKSDEGPPASAPDDSLRPKAVYSPTLKQTDVIIEGLQLGGDDENGMSLMVHFTVPGDVTGLRRSTSYPQLVSFDFSSFSEKSLFPGEPRITALADGKVVFETAEQFSTSKSPDDGRFSEYLSLHIPYAAFRRMTAGKSLTIRMGDREYEFTGEQVEALRGMTQYVKE